MNNVGVVAVRDYLANVANETELAEFEQLIAGRKCVLAERKNAGVADAEAGPLESACISRPTR